MNHGDLIGFGSNPSRDSCVNKRRIFLYEVRAPKDWDGEADDEEEEVDENAGGLGRH